MDVNKTINKLRIWFPFILSMDGNKIVNKLKHMLSLYSFNGCKKNCKQNKDKISLYSQRHLVGFIHANIFVSITLILGFLVQCNCFGSMDTKYFIMSSSFDNSSFEY